jgi:hypothetical protein
VRNQFFTFADGEVFGEDFAGDVVTLTFGPDGRRFRLEGRRGTFTFGPPCIADFDDADFDDISFPTCDYNPDDNTLLLVNDAGVSGLSAPGLPTGTGGSGD